MDIQEQNTSFYGCLNLSLYIFIRKVIPMAFRFSLLFHFTYKGVSSLSVWLNKYPCRQAFWNLLPYLDVWQGSAYTSVAIMSSNSLCPFFTGEVVLLFLHFCKQVWKEKVWVLFMLSTNSHDNHTFSLCKICKNTVLYNESWGNSHSEKFLAPCKLSIC